MFLERVPAIADNMKYSNFLKMEIQFLDDEIKNCGGGMNWNS